MNSYKYKKIIASILESSPDNVFLYWKGRVALYAALKALDIKKGDEVILPAFTCVVVPNSIIYLGAKPVYVDISLKNYNMDVEQLKRVITPHTKVIICQNTFGLSSNIEKIVEIARQYNLYTIEDCAHGFGGFYNGKPNGSYCDLAFFSTQWNKPFSTGIGGFLVVNNENLFNKIKILENKKLKTSFKDELILIFLLFINKSLVNRYTYWKLVKFYRFLSKNDIIIGSSESCEIKNIEQPQNYFKDMSSFQIKEGIKKLNKLKSINDLRLKNAIDYTQFLKSKGKTYVSEDLFENHLFLKYPLLVKNRVIFFSLAEKEKIILGDWFLSPIHPIKEKYELWGLNPFHFPIADSISKKMVNLPTDIKDNSIVIDFLYKYLEMIE